MNTIICYHVSGLFCQAFLACVIINSSFCRLTMIDSETIPEIRHSISFLGGCGVLLLGAPYFPILDPQLFVWDSFTTPWWVWLSLQCSVALVQIATSIHWSNGVPRCYISPEKSQERRMANDRRMA